MRPDFPTLEYLHPYYVASDLADLDAAFEDGKRRAIATLERRLDMIRNATRGDYEAAFLGRRADAKIAMEDGSNG